MKKWAFLFLLCGFLYADVNYLNMGIVAHNKELYSLSNQQLEKYIQQNPDGKYIDYAYLLYSINLIKLKKFNESREKLLFLIENFPKSKYIKNAYIYLILVNLELFDLNSSLKFYKEYAGKWGKDKQIENQIASKFIQEGISAFKKGDYKKGEKIFTNLINNFKECEYTDIANYYTGLIYYQKNDFEKAKEKFLKVGEKNIKILPDLYLKTGDCFLNLKDYNQAKKYYKKVIENFPDSESKNWALYQLTLIKKREGKLKEAEETIKKIKTNDNNLKIKCLKILLDIYTLEEKWVDAENTILEIFQKFPEEKSPANYIKLGFINFNMKNKDKAILYFKKALQLNPPEKLKEKAYFGLGYTYYLNGEIEKAFSLWGKIENQFPSSCFLSEIYYIKGKKYFEMNNYEKSKKYLKKILKYYKDSPFFIQSIPLLIQIYINEGNIKQAETLSEKFKEKDEEINFLYGKVLYIEKNYEKAKKIFEKAKIENPFLKVEVIYYLAQIYLYEGKKEKAKEKLLEIITYYPQFKEFSKLAEKQLKKLEK